ncbi:MAG: hypothetical protein ACTTH7_00225 [Treponema sp.]
MKKFFVIGSCILYLAALFSVSCKNNVSPDGGGSDNSLRCTVTFNLQDGPPPPQ